MVALPTQLLRVLFIRYIYPNINLEMCELSRDENSFLYFAYGSNLLEKRIHHSNPSAQFLDVGFLANYRLDFLGHSKTWGGSPATIVPTPNSTVWGTIWRMSNEHLETLDRQEGVHNGIYVGFYVDVTNENGTVYRCRTYRQTREIDEPVPLSVLPDNRRPSLIYLKTMIKGAQDCGIPEDYIDSLKSINHNGEESFSIGIKRMGLESADITWN